MGNSDGLRNSEYWRGRAEEARTRADDLRFAEGKALMLSIDHMYDVMGERAARRENPSDKRVERS